MNFVAQFHPKNWRSGRWFRPIPYRAWEMLGMRVLFAWLVLTAYPKHLPTADEGKEVGLARLMPLDWLAEPEVLAACWWVLLVAVFVYLCGKLYFLSLTTMAFLVIAFGSLANSQGGIGHDMNILGLALLAQWAWFAWRSIAAGEWFSASKRSQRLAIFYTQQVVVATYVTTAVWKLYKTSFGWIRESKYFPVQLVKTREANYYDKLERATGEGGGISGTLDLWFAKLTPHLESFLFANPNLCRAVIGSGLLLELLAFLALLGRGSRCFYGGLLVMFHLIIGRVMNLNFDYNVFLLLIFFVNLPWLGMVLWKRWRCV